MNRLNVNAPLYLGACSTVSIFVGFGVFPLAAALALILRVALLSDL